MFGWLRRIVAGTRADRAEGGDDDGIPLELAALPGAFDGGDVLPRPQWDVIRPAADALAGRYDPHRVWCEVQRQWLEALAAAFGEGARIVETRSALLLCFRYPDDAASLARLCENTLTSVHSILGGPPPDRCGKLPVFVLDSVETYYSYIAHFYGEGEYGTSAGCCVRERGGDLHVATVDTTHGLERTLAHEMVHATLRRGLPAWFEEGAAEVISRRVARDGPLQLDDDAVRKHLRYWGRHGLQSFWTGDSFQRGGRGQPLSYALAEVLVQHLLSDHGRRLRGFIDDAASADAGEPAARQHFGIGLGDLAAQFLGPGDWAPREAVNPDAPVVEEADEARERRYRGRA